MEISLTANKNTSIDNRKHLSSRNTFREHNIQENKIICNKYIQNQFVMQIQYSAIVILPKGGSITPMKLKKDMYNISQDESEFVSLLHSSSCCLCVCFAF